MTTEDLVPYETALFYKRLHHVTRLFYAGLYETSCFIKTDETSHYVLTNKGIQSVVKISKD